MSAGSTALASLEASPTVSVMVLTVFQNASAALTVTLKAVPAVRAVGVPVLPVTLPGTALSPGTSSCSLVNAAGLTTMLPEVALVKPLAVKLMVIVVATL